MFTYKFTDLFILENRNTIFIIKISAIIQVQSISCLPHYQYEEEKLYSLLNVMS